MGLQSSKVLTLFLVLILSSCGSDSGGPAPKNLTAEELPLLSKGKHVSLIKGFNVNQSTATDAAMDARWSEALSKGMAVGRFQLDWLELEPSPNQYDKKFLEDKLVEMQADGLQSFVMLSTIDSEGFTLPTDLNGMDMDNPVVLERFRKLLDWVVPMIVSHGGWVLAVGNEPGNYLSDFPAKEQSVVNFLANARSHSHSINPDLAITITLAYHNVELGQAFHIAFLKQCDVASFNYYGVEADFFFDNDVTRVNQEIDQMLNVAGGKLLILQELGAAAGFESVVSPMNATLTGQQQFFETVFTKMAAEPRFRVAVIFQLVDWDPALVDLIYTQPFTMAGLPQDFIARFAESLETTGLIQYADGSSRPSWLTIRDQIEKFNNK